MRVKTQNWWRIIVPTLSLGVVGMTLLACAVQPVQQGDVSAVTGEDSNKSPVVSFYVGDIRIERVDIQVNLGKKEASVAVDYTLVNEGRKSQDLELAFFPSTEALADLKPIAEAIKTFKPEETLKHPFDKPIRYSQPVRGDPLRGIVLDPRILFNGLHPGNPIGEYQLWVVLPSGVQDLVKVTRPPLKRYQEEERTVFFWTGKDIYFTPLELAWSTIGNVQIVKHVPEVRPSDGVIEVQLKVINRSEQELRGVMLLEDFNPGDFEPVAPSGEFEQVEGIPNDIRLLWRKTIDVLVPDQAVEVSYTVRMLNNVSTQRFARTQARVEDNLIGLSEVVYVRQRD